MKINSLANDSWEGEFPTPGTSHDGVQEVERFEEVSATGFRKWRKENRINDWALMFCLHVMAEAHDLLRDRPVTDNIPEWRPEVISRFNVDGSVAWSGYSIDSEGASER